MENDLKINIDSSTKELIIRTGEISKNVLLVYLGINELA